MPLAEVSKYLKKNGIRPLSKRILIYNYLITYRNHPTVEMIYKDLLPIAPSLSKTTVYNVLSLFLEKNLVQALNIEGNEIRYDADTMQHGHFKCMQCAKVFDFQLENQKLPQLPLEGFTIHQTHYYLDGICASCNQLKLN